MMRKEHIGHNPPFFIIIISELQHLEATQASFVLLLSSL